MGAGPAIAGAGPSGVLAAVSCPHCHLALDHERMASGQQLCPRCLRSFEAVVFHPPARRLRVEQVEESGPQGATSCATHRRNTAVANCSRCGIFICTLCRVEADRKVFCPACFDRLAAEGALDSARTRYRDWASLGQACAAFGLVPFLGLALGPGAVYMGWRAVQQKEELGETAGRTALYVTMFLGVLETLGWAAFIVWLFRA